MSKSIYYPNKPTPNGFCHACNRKMTKPTSLFCNKVCLHEFYNFPSDTTIQRWIESEGVVKATDGCRVEPDGICPHGFKSWLLVLGMI